MTDSVKQQCKMPDCVLSKFFHNHNHPNCSYGNNTPTPPVNESWEKKYNDEWWKIMDKIKDVGASADSLFAKDLMRELIKSLLSTARQEAEDSTWTKAWLNGLLCGMNFFDTTGVSGTKVPKTGLTIKQTHDQFLKANTLTKTKAVDSLTSKGGI